jgi:hypothetical protein
MKVFVEGGGDDRATGTRCREAFAAFFAKVAEKGRLPKVVPCGGRDQTFKDFRTALAKEPDALLLVDAKDAALPAALANPWLQLADRDGWKRPDAAGPTNVALMVQEMESWFLADRGALAAYYGRGFREKALPARQDIENVSKAAVNAGLAAATKDTKAREYHKTQHGFDLIARIDPKLVRAASPHADRLCRIVRGEPVAQPPT